MAAPTLPFASSVVARPGLMPAYRELCEVIAQYQAEIYRLQSQLSQYETGARIATDAMQGAMQASKLEHALRALVKTERGRRLMGAVVRPARGDCEFNTAAAVVRRILEI